MGSAFRIHRERRKSRFITSYIIAGGFLALIAIGTALLCMPISSASGEAVPPLDALFTTTSAVCVTGLVTVPTFSTWSIFGQIVILLLVQLGGLGLITFTAVFLQLMKRRIGLREHQLIRDAYGLEEAQGMGELVKKIVVGTLIVEAAGAALYMATFVPQFGAAGIWKSVFNAVSAFCNAGMDILGPDSLMQYRDNWNVNLVTMALTILGGLGFPIWFILIDRIKDIRAKRISRKRAFRGLPIYAKAVLLMTVVLLFGGAILVFILEYNNEATLSNLPLHEKILAAMFQSMTLRTAGFCTISQAGLTRGTMLISCVLMFIGGSPAGTAGGIKTTTVLILLSSLFSSLSDRNETHFARRRISAKNVRRAMTVFMTSFAVMLAALIVFCAVQPGTFEDCLYEVASAIGTVGLSRDFTATLNAAGKLIIIATMYLGRIGPISLALFFNTKKYVNLIEYPEENLPVG